MQQEQMQESRYDEEGGWPESTSTGPKRKASELRRAASANVTGKKKSVASKRQGTISIDNVGSGPASKAREPVQPASLPPALRGRAEGKAAHEGNVVAPVGLCVGVADDAHRLQVLLRPVVDVARARLRDVRPLPRGRRTAVSEPGRSGAGAQHEGGSAARTMPRCTPPRMLEFGIVSPLSDHWASLGPAARRQMAAGLNANLAGKHIWIAIVHQLLKVCPEFKRQFGVFNSGAALGAFEWSTTRPAEEEEEEDDY